VLRASEAAEMNELLSPAGHALLYSPETVDQVADIIVGFLTRHLTRHVTPDLSSGSTLPADPDLSPHE